MTQNNFPWTTEKEFYDLYSNKIFSSTKFYHMGFIGSSDEDFLKYIAKRAKLNTDSRVVDLGCGSGYLVNELQKHCKIMGISNSEKCIEQCKINYPDSEFVVSNIEDFQIGNLTHCLSLESIGSTNRENAFKNINKNLVSEGLLYIKDLCLYPGMNKMVSENKTAFEEYWKYYLISVEDMIRLGYRTGFSLIDFKRIFKVNMQYVKQILKLHEIEFIEPYPHEDYLIPAEFLFMKN